MAKVTTYCPDCNQQAEFNKSFAGRMGMCPECDAIWQVPGKNTEKQKFADEQKQGRKKCPNCFEYSQASVKSCSYCGEYMGKYEFNEICPNCKEEQPPGNKYCRECGVNIATGLYDGMVKRKCPGCGNVASGMENVCVICKTPLNTPITTVKIGKIAKKVSHFVGNNAAMIFFLCLLMIGAYTLVHWKEIKGSFSDSYYGEKEADLRAAVEKFSAAMRYHDWSGISSSLAVSRKISHEDFLILLGTSQEKNTEGIYDLQSLKISRVSIDQNNATVYLNAIYKKTLKAKNEENDSQDDPTAWLKHLDKTKNQMKQQKQQKDVAWQWTYLDGQWKRNLED